MSIWKNPRLDPVRSGMLNRKTKGMQMTMRFLLAAAAVALAAFAGSVFVKGEPVPASPAPTVESLVSLPYLTWMPVDEEEISRSGVTVCDESKAFRGLNFYNSHRDGDFHLMDMKGKILHTWSAGEGAWLMAAVDAKGNLYALDLRKQLLKLDRDSRRVWSKELKVHHEALIAENGDVLTLEMSAREVIREGRPLTVLDNLITVLSPEGEVRRRISVYDMLGDEIRAERIAKFREYLERRPDGDNQNPEGTDLSALNAFHTNSIAVFDRDIPGVAGKGDLLISVRELDTLAVIDREAEKIVWSWGQGEIHRQHDAQILDNGNFLVFDNLGIKGYSRIIELNPRTKTIEQVYGGTSAESFYSEKRGASQKLPNGNILIVESEKGRVFEVTPRDEIVWEFRNPVVRPDKKERAAIYRLRRLDPEKFSGFPFEPGIRKYLLENGYFESRSAS